MRHTSTDAGIYYPPRPSQHELNHDRLRSPRFLQSALAVQLTYDTHISLCLATCRATHGASLESDLKRAKVHLFEDLCRRLLVDTQPKKVVSHGGAGQRHAARIESERMSMGRQLTGRDASCMKATHDWCQSIHYFQVADDA